MPCPLINIIFLDILRQTKIKVAFIVGMLCFIFKLRIIPFLRRLPYHYWDTSFWRYVWYPPYPLSCRLIVLFPFPLFAYSFFCKIRWIVRKIIAHEKFFYCVKRAYTGVGYLCIRIFNWYTMEKFNINKEMAKLKGLNIIEKCSALDDLLDDLEDAQEAFT